MRRLAAFLVLIQALDLALPCARGQSPARQAGYLYLSPLPGASYVSPQTRYILVRLEQLSPSEVTNLFSGFITVTGASSGSHAGATKVATDGKTVRFQMGTDFTANEFVTVTLNPLVKSDVATNIAPYQYQFRITAPMPGSLPMTVVPARKVVEPPNPVPMAKALAPTGTNLVGWSGVPQAVLMPNGVSVPSDFPKVVITANTNPSPGFLFLENGLDNKAAPYTMMLDNTGSPVWYRRGRMYDFKIQRNGIITWCLSDDTGFPAFDQNFNYLKTYLTTNGYSTDGHELKVLEDGSYFMIGYRTNTVNMGLYVQGGTPAIVRETVVQGFTAADELVFQWRAWDNYAIGDQPGNTDFPHMNGVDIDEDGNVLVSARHLSEVTKINRDSGDIMWRLSGAHNNFAFINDPFNGTSFQHNISALGGGHYTVFDNGNYHSPQVSRAVEYLLDLTNLTATIVWQFRDTPDKYTYWLGNAQRLPTGNTLINFVQPQYPKAIEVDAKGVKHFELSLVPGSDAYRAFRLPWTGVVAAPYLIVEPQVDSITLLFNKFGDSNVAYYRIYGGDSPHPTTLLEESTTTLKNLSNLRNGLYYFRVTAMSTDGTESAFSNEESLSVNIVPPGQNLVVNGDFSQGLFDWGFRSSGTAIATADAANGIGTFFVTNGATSLSSVQLVQSGKTILQGETYVLEFDAWATQSRYIDVKVAQSVSPFTDYSRITLPYLTPNPTHYRYVFTMQLSSDFSANLLFNLGAFNGGVSLDNVSLISPPTGDLNQDGRVNVLDLEILARNWLKKQNGLAGDLNSDGKVDFADFSILGGNWSSEAR